MRVFVEPDFQDAAPRVPDDSFARTVLEAFERLDCVARAAAALIYIAEYSEQEAAAATGCSEQHFRQINKWLRAVAHACIEKYRSPIGADVLERRIREVLAVVFPAPRGLEKRILQRLVELEEIDTPPVPHSFFKRWKSFADSGRSRKRSPFTRPGEGHLDKGATFRWKGEAR